MIHIITSFFISKLSSVNISERNAELVSALRKNTESPYVKVVHLFVDDEPSMSKLQSEFASELSSGKIIIVSQGKQPLYADFFKYANESCKGQLCMITNSDIYVHSCETKLFESLLNTPLLYALTRHEHDMSCPLINDYHGSHDSFIFQSPLAISIEKLEFPQNVWGSEHKLLSVIYNNGIRIQNPCRQIQIVHLHKSNIRETDRIWISWHTPEDIAGHHPPILL